MNATSLSYPGYILNACAHIATHFDSLEKASKISFRLIDITAILRGVSTPFILLSSQIKSLVILIESTRIFVIAPTLFIRDDSGKNFFQKSDQIKIAEKTSVTAHTILKMVQGAECTDLIHLGRIATYSFANMPVFRWAVESTIWMFYFFGAYDSVRDLVRIHKDLGLTIRSHDNSEAAGFNGKFKEMKIVQANLQIDATKAWMKLAANISKIILVTLAVAFAVLNLNAVACQLTLLSLGVLSDTIGLSRIFYIEYSPILR